MGSVAAQLQDLPVLFGQRLGAVAEENHQVRPLDGFPGPLDAQSLHPVSGLPDAGGVDEPQPGGAYQDGLLHRVPGGAGNIRDDDPVKARQSV